MRGCCCFVCLFVLFEGKVKITEEGAPLGQAAIAKFSNPRYYRDTSVATALEGVQNSNVENAALF